MMDDEKKNKLDDFTKTKKVDEDFDDPWDEDAIREVAEKIIERITR